MPTRIADTRSPIQTTDDADQCMAAIAKTECQIALIKARAHNKIATINQKLAADLIAPKATLEKKAVGLTAFILAFRSLFTKPRQRKTESGSYGLRNVSEVVIDNTEILIAHLMEQGYEECFEVKRTPIKKTIMERLKKDEQIPGCFLNQGDVATYKTSPGLIAEAKESAL